jgi:O-antigen ligase
MGLFQIGVLLTGSRGATAASLVAWLFLPWVFVRLKAYKKTAAVVLGGALLFGALALVPPSSWERLSETGEQIESGSFSERGPVWRAGWEVFQSHPIFGVGAGAFQASVASQLPGHALSPHNVFVSVAVELGLVGLALLFGILLCLVLGSSLLPAFDRRLALVLMATWIISAMAFNCEYEKATWFLFGLIATQVGGRVRLGHPARSSLARASQQGYA